MNQTEPGPGELFATLWQQVEPFISQIVSEPWCADSYREYRAFALQFHEHDEDSVPDDVSRYLAGETKVGWQVPATEEVKRAFVIMRALDWAARVLLPEVSYSAPGALLPNLGHMMRRVRDRLQIDGCMAATADGKVILRGPLSSERRAETARNCNGDHLADQFENLTIVKPPTANRAINLETLAPSEFQVPAGAARRVGLAPIAEDEEDLRFQSIERGGRCFLDALPGNPARLAERAATTVQAMLDEGAELIALPELVMSPDAVAAVKDALRTRSSSAGSLVVLGSGLAPPEPGGTLHYNESVVVDGRGREIFRQRKLHHYNMAASRMADCRIATLRSAPHIENVASGKVLEVRDLPGLGRVMILICEDFAQSDPAGEAAKSLRPDWVIVPVLDLPPSRGRWHQQNAFFQHSYARVVVSCSLTLEVRKRGCGSVCRLPADASVGMLFDGLERAAVHFVKLGAPVASDVFRVAAWDSASWELTDIGTRSR